MENRDPQLWKQAKARAGFKIHLRSYLIVISCLWAIWLLTSLLFSNGRWNGFHYPWPIWAMLGWGIGLASHYFTVYHGQGENNLAEREYEKLRQKRA
ncbi:2TM domain-containing protein [Tellurirhabdus bombi]|uniref:2TM domain-containing protein n=1 Tax=Tellurirhabdus bombi TaxID=2907205 RepID=UPI001F1787ED|nr:2TM domain-containing protein [Tellurirhabdus bombi]